MEIILKNENPKIQSVIKELLQELVQKKSKNPLTLYVVQDKEKGFLIELQTEVITIHYHKNYDFARALLKLLDSDVAALYNKDPMMEITQDLYVVSEACAFEDFGMMVDCSRNAVPKVDTIKKQIRLLALMGYQFIGLYVEDTIKVEGEPYFGYGRGAYTPEEIKEISRYAAIFDMQVRPYIQTLAHFNQIKRYEAYQEFMDFDDILLVEDEKTYAFLEHIIKTVSTCFSGKIINIGMDEAHMIGLGKYLDLHGYQNRVEIMKKHLNRVLSICDKYGLQAQMWSDMFFKLIFGGNYYVDQEKSMEEEIKKLSLPKNLQLVYWDYYSCDENRYDSMLKKHLLLSKNAGFAGGAWKWTGFTPHNEYSIQTSKAALEACMKNKIKSVVITAWGDNGAESSLFSILPALFFDAKVAYGNHMSNEVFEKMTGMKFLDFMKIDKVNPYGVEKQKHNNAGKYYLYNDPFLGTFDSAIMENPKDYYKDVKIQLEKRCKNKSYGYLFQTQMQLCKVLEIKADLGIEIQKAYLLEKEQKELHGKKQNKHKKAEKIANQKIQTEVVQVTDAQSVLSLEMIYQTIIPHLLADLSELYEDFFAQWHRENKSFGFEIQTIRFGGLEKRLKDIAKILEQYHKGEISIIEELEEEKLPFAYFSNDEKESLSYNLWSDIVSAGVIG